MSQSFVYIMSNKRLTTLYIGVTNNLEGRVFEHKMREGSKFATKYKLNRLKIFIAIRLYTT